ncbi:Uncharacterised protein [Cedecea neteri]|uniref:Uncharacterized protein n=1 Tax=Cedecea neteri TaxID=158822 RepID=A0A2X2TDE9_9ENTR|nr:Uncharacterised protein [Cedecea neteri]
MKSHNKEQIQAEVSAALVNVNLVRISEKPPQTKTVYQDSPETLRRLKDAESLSASLLAQLREAQQRSAQGDSVETSARLQRYEKQVAELQKALNISQEMHLKESALVRSVMQREIDELKSLLNRQKESGFRAGGDSPTRKSRATSAPGSRRRTDKNPAGSTLQSGSGSGAPAGKTRKSARR